MPPPPPDPTTDAVAPPPTASGTGGDTNPRPGPAPGPHRFLSPPQAPDEMGRLGAYRVLAELGRGGMGVVFRAEDTVLRRQVALKVMLPDVAADPRAKARFLREARAQAAVEHEHVAVIHQVGEEVPSARPEGGGVPFIAMPLLRGQTLAQALKQNPRPPVAEVVRIGREIAEGLAASHEKGLIHRDIKPANIWLDGPKRRVRILDFGLARAETAAAGDDEQLTGRGAILGTPAYMSPEQAKGEAVDSRSDLFSLGIVLYEMATGKKPFVGPNTLAVLFAVAEQYPPAAHQADPDVPVTLSELIWRLMSKAPAERPAGAAAVAAELEAFEAGLSTSRAVPLPTAVAAPAGADPWAELTDAPPAAESEDDETEYDEPPARPTPAGVPRWVWPAVGLAVLLAVAAGVWVAMPPRQKAVAEKEPDAPKPVPGGTSAPPKPPKPNPPPEPPAPNPPAAAVPELTAENRAALEWVLANGGRLCLFVGPKEVPVPAGGKLPSEPFTVADLMFIGVPVPNDLAERLAAAPPVRRGLHLQHATFTDPIVGRLLGLPCFAGINHLSLAESPVAGASLAAVGRLPALTSLNLPQTKVTDPDLAHLRGLRLTNISLHMCPVTDAGMAHLADMASLTHLWLMYTYVTDAGLAKLSKLTNLTYLHPGGITDAGVETLLGFRQLSELYLVETQVTAAGLRRLAALPIAQLSLTGRSIADADLAVLQDFPALSNLALTSGKERITDAGLKHLAECPGLRRLNLADTRVTDAGVKELSAKLPLCEIVWGADQKIAPKPLDEVLRASVAELLKAGAKITVPNGDVQRELKSADDLKAGERVWEITFGSRGPFNFSAAVAALKTFPGGREGWSSAFGGAINADGPLTEAQFRDLIRIGTPRGMVGLSLNSSELTEAAFVHFKYTPDLRSLNINYLPKMSESGLKHIAALPKLHWLGIHSTMFTPAALAALRDSAITTLDLGGAVGIDDTAVEHLAAMHGLRSLALKATKVTKAGVEKLAAAQPRCHIVWDGGEIKPRSALGYGLEFDGASSYVTFPTLKYDGSHPLTLEMWLAPNPPSTNLDQCLFGDIESAGVGLLFSGGAAPNTWEYASIAHVGGRYQNANAVSSPKPTLIHVAAVFDGRGKNRLYLDGKLAASTDMPGAFRASPLSFMLGANPGAGNVAQSSHFSGTVTGVRVSKSARYAADFAPQLRLSSDADTLALYQCDQDGGDALTDTSGNNHHGKIVGAKWAAANEGDIAANRRGAEKLNPHAELTLRLPGGPSQTVLKGGKLPDGPFTVVRVYLPPNKLLDRFTDDTLLPALADLRAVGDIGSLPWVLKPTDAHLARLAALPVAQSLWHLGLGFELSGPAIDALKRFPRLAAVLCNGTDADDPLLERLAELPGLTGLSLENLGKSGKVTARGAAALAKLPLRDVTLAGAPAAAEYVKLAGGARDLVRLSVWGSPFADADVKNLAACARLESLNLDATPVTDAGLKHLEELHRLRYVGLTRTAVTEAGVKALAKALPRCQIEWAGGLIQPKPDAEVERAAAEMLNPHFWLGLKLASGREVEVKPGEKLPAEAFAVERVSLAERRVPDDEVNDVFFRAVAHLRSLRVIYGWGTLVLSEQQVDRLTRLPLADTLGNLTIAAQLTPAMLDRLKLFPLLYSLGIWTNEADDELLARLVRERPRLTSVCLSFWGNTKATPHGLAVLADLNLGSLNVTDAPIDAAFLRRLATKPKLWQLSFWNTPIGDGELKELTNCKNVSDLRLYGAKVTDAGLEHLKAMSRLTHLELGQTQVTEEGARKLAAALPKCEVVFDGKRIEPKK
jgi:serine/threonine protein kinase